MRFFALDGFIDLCHPLKLLGQSRAERDDQAPQVPGRP
jgi:hypothetical protein